MIHFQKIQNAVLLPLILSIAVVNHAQTRTSAHASEPLTATADGQRAAYLAGLTDVKPGANGKLWDTQHP